MGCLSSYSRIKHPGRFQSAYRRAKPVHTQTVVIFYIRSNDKDIGFTASKKVGNAVKRNFAKRRMRALFDEFCQDLEPGTYVLVAKAAIIDTSYDQIRAQLKKAFQKIRVLRR